MAYMTSRDIRMKILNNFIIKLKQYKISNAVNKAAIPLLESIKKEVDLYKSWHKFEMIKMILDFIFPMVINATSLFSLYLKGKTITTSLIIQIMESFSIISVNL